MRPQRVLCGGSRMVPGVPVVAPADRMHSAAGCLFKVSASLHPHQPHPTLPTARISLLLETTPIPIRAPTTITATTMHKSFSGSVVPPPRRSRQPITSAGFRPFLHS